MTGATVGATVKARVGVLVGKTAATPGTAAVGLLAFATVDMVAVIRLV